MKIIFSSISRLIFSYSKFLAGLVLFSTIGTYAHSSEGPTYLKCKDRYYKLTGTSIQSSYNVRTKKFTYSSEIWSYTNDYIFLVEVVSTVTQVNGKWRVKLSV